MPFEVPVDGDEETGFKEEVVTIRFADKPRSWLRPTLDKINAGEVTDEEVCREVIEGWEDVEDEKGNAILFSAEGLERLLEKRNFPGSAISVFFGSLAGRKAKNLPTPQGTGSEPAA